jgi:ubiquinone/menaquinone biosynthesis C-methylase UbiE
MDLASALNDLKAIPGRGLREGAHILRGVARAAGISAHNALVFPFVFPPETRVKANDEEEHALRQRIIALFEADWRNVQEGIYPASLAQEFDWAAVLRLYPRLMLDAPRMRKRVLANDFEELPDEASSYPTYYRRNFHFQTHGYLGLDSAEIYDTQVELLFGGTAAAMRRQVLPPVVRALRGREPSSVRILDVACGTGAFLRMLATVLPGARLYGLDLSPHYIAHARRSLADIVPLSLVSENAEHLPFVDGYFDAVTNIYLMHEIPPQVRDRVLREIGRVLKPGGTFMLADSAQLADVPELSRFLKNFPKQLHEPYYRQYSRDHLTGRIEEAGFDIEDNQTHFLTKVITARRRGSSA